MTIKVKGKIIDNETRCTHYHSPNDVIAIKFKCCNQYYSCYQCHEEDAAHSAEIWSTNDYDKMAVLCGVCKTELTILQYMDSHNTCPHCKTSFNPNCSKHYNLYFEARNSAI